MISSAFDPDARRLGQDLFEVRLTQELVLRGVLGQEKLEEALRQQVILGGHLATNLWELRLVDGKRLTQISAEILGVPVADPKLINAAPAEVRRIFTREFVSQSHILPFCVVGSVLQVATAEPWNMMMLGRAAFHGGYPVEPYFMPEVPLSALLEKIYAIPTSARFWLGVHANEKRAKPADPFMHDEPAGEEEAKPNTLLSYVSSEVAKLRGRRQAAAGKLGERARLIVQPLSAAEVEAAVPKPVVPILEIKQAYTALEGARDRDAVGSVLLRLALGRGRRALLFMRRESAWVGWMGEGEGVSSDKVSILSLPDLPDTFYSLVAQTGSHYLGPMQPNIAYAPLLLALGGGKPRSFAFLPVRLRGRLVFGVYLDGGPEGYVSADVSDILLLAQRVPAALERLIAERKAAKAPPASETEGQSSAS